MAQIETKSEIKTNNAAEPVTDTATTTTTNEPAKLRTRLLAMVYDGLLILFITTVVVVVIQGILIGGKELPPEHILIKILKPFWFVPGFFYLAYYWTKNGQTPSMKIWKIKLIDQQGQLVSWPKALLRYVTAFLGLGIILGLFNKKRASLQDILSGTTIVKTTNELD